MTRAKLPPVKETNDRWITQYGDYEFEAGPNCTPEEAKAKNDRMRELRRTKPRITENHDDDEHDGAENLFSEDDAPAANDAPTDAQWASILGVDPDNLPPEDDAPDDPGNLDRFGWGPGELVLLSSPVMTDEQIAAWNAEQRAAGLARIAAKKKAKDGE